MKRFFLTVLTLSMLFFLVIPLESARASELKEGDMMGDFSLPNGLTKKITNFNDDIKGKSKITVIIFANTACSACRKELKLLSILSTKYDDLTTYVILVDMRGKDIVADYNDQFRYNVTYLLDPEFTIPPQYGYSFTPSLVVVDKEGVIVYKKGGFSIIKDDTPLRKKLESFFD